MRTIPLGPNVTADEVKQAVRQLINGQSNATGTVTLTAGTSTVVSHEFVVSTSHISMSPVSANSAGVAWWISARANKTFTISHPAGAADRSFTFEVRSS